MNKSSWSRSNILIVDDQKHNLKLLYEILMQESTYQVYVAKNGLQALEISKQTHPELCLLDINMPKMNGYEVCRLLKKDSRTATIPVIFLSALGEMEDKLKGFFVGGVDYITKPFHTQEVLARIRTHLSLYWTQQALQQNEARLRIAHEELETKVNERTRELQEANVRLQDMARMKDEFLASMNHELRTPLNAILGNAEIIKEGIYGPVNTQQAQALGNILDSGEHLLSLINDILDLSRANAGKLKLRRQAVNVQTVIDECIAFVRSTAEKKHLSISISKDAQVSVISADPLRLKQVILNLLHNAVKFTPEAGHVGIECNAKPEQQQVEFVIWDTGIGIPEAFHSKLFQPFVQLDSRLSREYEGSGLGLSLTKNLVELHEGSISVSSQTGQGTYFYIYLPWDEEIPEQPVLPKVFSNPSRDSQAQARSKKTILLTEDNPQNQMVITDYLQAKGYHVEVADDGLQALDKVFHIAPDLVIMDIQMPGMDGLQVIKTLRAQAQFKHLPILAVTGLTMPGDENRCLQAGADAYLSKPISMKNLFELTQRLLDVSPHASEFAS